MNIFLLDFSKYFQNIVARCRKSVERIVPQQKGLIYSLKLNDLVGGIVVKRYPIKYSLYIVFLL